MAMEQRRINLGCGKDIRVGWINYDYLPQSPCVRRLDLNKLPWDIESDSVDEILYRDSIEHLRIDPLQAMEECRRILKPSGKLVVRAPSYRGTYAHMPDHRWFFSAYWFMDLTHENFCRTPPRPLFVLGSVKLEVFMGRPTPLDWLASRMPLVWERFLLAPDSVVFTGFKPRMVC